MYFFIGGVFPKNEYNVIVSNSKGSVQEAANVLQWSFIKGLDFYIDKMKIISLPFVGTYPRKYNKIFVNKSLFNYSLGCIGEIIPFCTIPLIGLFSKYFSLKKKLLLEVKESDVLVVYSMHTPFLLAILKLKKRYPNIHLCLIVPDLPQYMSESNNFLYQMLKKIDGFIITKTLRYIDSFVLLSDYMAVALKIEKRFWIRIEGICSSVIRAECDKEDIFTFYYTGTLDFRYGIQNLLIAFSMLKREDLQLWICGKGNAEKCVEDYVRQDKRIKYYGQIPHEDVLKLQQRATVLINPRTSEGDYTLYSFPSKIIEYLASGTPCIMHLLPAIPLEYKKYIYFADEGAYGLFKVMNKVCLMSQKELREFGDSAKSFVLRYKNSYSQVKLMLEMINK